MRFLYITLLVLVAYAHGNAQTTQQRQSFENTTPADELPFTTNVPQYADGPGDDVFGIVASLPDIPAAQDGAQFFGAIDIQSPGTMDGDGILTFDAGDICNLVNPQFAWYYNVRGLDNGDDLFYQLILDGFPEDPVKYVDGGNAFSTPGWVEMTVDVPNRAVDVQLRLILDQNGSDQIGIDNIRVLATGTNGACTPICGVRINSSDVMLTCNERTEPDGVDGVTATINYRGGEAGAVVSATSGVTIAAGSDDPAAVPDGTIELNGLVEGGNYVLSISGGDCSGADVISVPISVPDDFCTPSNLVINEILADPGSVNDANGDGFFDSGQDEFVELYNSGPSALDVSGYTIEEGSGVFYEFPPGTVIQALDFYTVFGGGNLLRPTCSNADVANQRNFIGLNNTGDQVVVRDTRGREVASMSYGPEGDDDQALGLNPDGNLAGGYVPHSTILINPVINSACSSNSGNILAGELQRFTATVAGKQVILRWVTESEQNSSHFVIDRSTDGRNWNPLGQVSPGPAAGNAYSFIDGAPLTGTIFYRLRWVDLAGGQTSHGPVTTTFSGTNELLLHPNPTSTRIHFNRGVRSGDVVTVRHATGRVVRRVRAGSHSVDVSDLAAGVYYVVFARGAHIQAKCFVKR